MDAMGSRSNMNPSMMPRVVATPPGSMSNIPPSMPPATMQSTTMGGGSMTMAGPPQTIGPSVMGSMPPAGYPAGGLAPPMPAATPPGSVQYLGTQPGVPLQSSPQVPMPSMSMPPASMPAMCKTGQPLGMQGQYMPNVSRPQMTQVANPPVVAGNIQYGPSYKMQYQRRSTADKTAVKYTGFLPLEGVYEEDTCRIG
mmetsp:Transcript_55590/g.129419  ORF Transcript_55590/g.129419 Transcript_55590/m.129419 type:complete len:197 (-) Transcript_55590:162-752(-)